MRTPSSDVTQTPLSGFVAMEYYGLILNRTFIVFIGPEGLYGYKVRGLVQGFTPFYYLPFVDQVEDLKQKPNEVKKLSALDGGFFISRADILSSDIIHKQKWGMWGFPQSGRIRVHLMSGRTREFILLGKTDGDRLLRELLQGPLPHVETPLQQSLRLPCKAQTPKKIWIPVFAPLAALLAYLWVNIGSLWRDSWITRIEIALVLIVLPVFFLLDSVVMSTTLTETEIRQRTRLGRLSKHSYSDICGLSTDPKGILRIDFRDGASARIFWQRNLLDIVAVLKAKTGLPIEASDKRR